VLDIAASEHARALAALQDELDRIPKACSLCADRECVGSVLGLSSGRCLPPV
jgi:hypothetical protein